MTSTFIQDIANRMEQAKADMGSLVLANDGSEKIVKIDPSEIASWEFRDRQDFELGSIEDLANSIVTKGQAQPIVVVESSNVFKAKDVSASKYIVIAGYRRWLACKSRRMPVDAIIRKLSFEQAIACLVSENEKEKVSDYSKGMFYYNLIQQEKAMKKTIYERLGIHRAVFENFLSFAEVPKEVWDSVKDMSKVSARTSYAIKSICQKGEKEKNAILAIANKIAEGIGEKKINALVNKIIADADGKSGSNVTRVTFSENAYIELKNDSLIVTAKKVDRQQMDFLKERFSQILKELSEG